MLFFAGAHFSLTFFFLILALGKGFGPESEPNLIEQLAKLLFQTLAFFPLAIEVLAQKIGFRGLNDSFEWSILVGNSLLWGAGTEKIIIKLRPS